MNEDKTRLRTLVISRRRWLRGEGYQVSRLYRRGDKKMCCLGFLARQCGLRVRDIRDLPGPTMVRPSWAFWPEGLFDGQNNSKLACAMMTTNDAEGLRARIRERELRAQFRQLGYRVIFKP